MNGSRAAQRVRVTVGDRHTASMVGAHLLGEVADRTGLLRGMRRRCRGRVSVPRARTGAGSSPRWR